MNIFVTGTDTDVGKTVVSTILALKLNWHYWKPIQSGAISQTDRDWVSRHPVKVYDEQYILQAPLSPHRAAELEGITIDVEPILKFQIQIDQTVIEGAGGLMVPINAQDLMIDLIEAMAIPTVLVARTTLGTINHTLLSLAALRDKKIPVLGVILVGDLNPPTKQTIEAYGQVSILGEIPKLKNLNTTALKQSGDLIHLTEYEDVYSQITSSYH